jgi:hypothetical protein
MSTKYNCISCNYETSIHCNYLKHLSTDKHCSTVHSILNNDKINKNICQFCKKTLSPTNRMSRHHKTCKEKIKHELIITKEIQLLTKENELNIKHNELSDIHNELNDKHNIINKQMFEDLMKKTQMFEDLMKKTQMFEDLMKKTLMLETTLGEMKNTIDRLLSDKIKTENRRKYMRKKDIPATVRNTVWATHCNADENKCFCCKTETITRGNFECGHIKSEHDGGKVELANLRPICSLCNKSMYTQNMIEFMKQYGFDDQ